MKSDRTENVEEREWKRDKEMSKWKTTPNYFIDTIFAEVCSNEIFVYKEIRKKYGKYLPLFLLGDGAHQINLKKVRRQSVGER